MLFCILTAFFSFGFFHLGKFETTDEHLWKYDRIGEYWEALADQDWKKTYINDKPGITVALISGIGLLWEPHPEENVSLSQSPEMNRLFESYNVAQSEKTNITFRLPVLIFSTLALLAFFFLLQSAFGSSSVALLGTLLLALNPILVGMSQIINPDSFFWIFGGLAIVAFIALENTKKRSFLFLCGLLTGFALLSKYTAFILFLFYGIFLLAHMIFQSPQEAKKITLNYLLKRLGDIILIFLIAIVAFSLFLPATFVEPEYLFKGISQFFSMNTVASLLVGVSLLALLGFFGRKYVGTIFFFLATKRFVILTGLMAIVLTIVLVSILNVWTGERLAPVDALRDAAYANEPKEFNFKPLLDRKDSNGFTTIILFLMEFHPLIFSLSPLVFFALILALFRIRERHIERETAMLLFTVILFTLCYIASTLFAKVVTNARYLIVLYPLFAILAAVIFAELLEEKKRIYPRIIIGVAVLYFIFGSILLFSLRPFYFSYTNFLLPQSFSVHDSWGHGSYEAAQYLNALPEAETIIIWSNSDTVCRFFVGKCLKSRRIDLEKVTPDFFVISKRGAIKTSNRFLLLNNPQPEKDSDYYFKKLEDSFVWHLFIRDRPDNFIKILPFEK